MSPGQYWHQDYWHGQPDAGPAPAPIPVDPNEYETGAAILAAVLRRAGEVLPTVAAGHADIATSDRLIDARLAINQAYWEICGLRAWRWTRARLQFATPGSLAVTVTSVSGVTVELPTGLPATQAGAKLLLGSDDIPHRIAVHTAGSRFLTLEAPYTGTATGGAGTIFRDEVALPVTDLLGSPSLASLDAASTVTLIPEAELREMAPRNTLGLEFSGRRYAAFVDDHTLWFVPWTPTPRLFELAYNRRPAPLTFDGLPSDVPLVPRDSRVVIADRALERLLPDKRDARGQAIGAFTSDTYNRLLSRELAFRRPRQYVPPGRSIAGR